MRTSKRTNGRYAVLVRPTALTNTQYTETKKHDLGHKKSNQNANTHTTPESPENKSDASLKKAKEKHCVSRLGQADPRKKQQHKAATRKIRSGATPQLRY